MAGRLFLLLFRRSALRRCSHTRRRCRSASSALLRLRWLLGLRCARSRTARSGILAPDARIARDLAARLYLNLPIADMAGHLAGGVDVEPLARGQVAFELAADVGIVDVDVALEGATFGNLDDSAAHRRLDVTLHHESIAGLDFPLEPNVTADNELAAFAFRARSRRHTRHWRTSHARRSRTAGRSPGLAAASEPTIAREIGCRALGIRHSASCSWIGRRRATSGLCQWVLRSGAVRRTGLSGSTRRRRLVRSVLIPACGPSEKTGFLHARAHNLRDRHRPSGEDGFAPRGRGVLRDRSRLASAGSMTGNSLSMMTSVVPASFRQPRPSFSDVRMRPETMR